MTEAHTGARERIRATTEALWQRVRHTELERVAVIETAVAALVAGRLDDDGRALAEREAHKISGSAGTFGRGRASEIARELETILAARFIDRDAAAVATALVDDLYAALSPSAASSPQGSVGGPEAARAGGGNDRSAAVPGSPAGSAPIVVILHPSAELALAVADDARTRGLIPEIAPDVPAARNTLTRSRPPAAAVIHLPGAADTSGINDLLGDLDRLGTAVVGLLPPNAGTAIRAAALRAGARLLLDAPIDTAAGAAQITDAIATLLKDRGHSVPRVLAVDDDETVLHAVRHLLGTTSVQIETLSEPEGFWAALRQFQPDLLLLDVDMPGVSGLELCRLVRSDPRWSQLPVVFLSASHDAEAVGRVYAAGADDFVSKPVAGPELQARITNRLERARLHRLLAETDPLTGLANRRRLERDLNRLQHLADRYHSDLSLAVVDVDHFKRVNDRYGHASGDEVLRRLAGHLQAAFRGEDAVARVGGEEFVVAMLGMRREDAVNRLAGVLQSFRDIPQEISGELLTVAASAGVAQHNRDGVGFEALYRAADGALRAAKASGRGRVLPAGPDLPRDAVDADAAIVGNGEVLVELLRQTLTSAGYRCVVLPDGRQAVDRVTASTGAPHPVLVLLDIDLPGRSGFEVLPVLPAPGVGARMPVMVVTARATESEAMRRAGTTD